MIKEAEIFAEDDKKERDRVYARNELESLAHSLKTQVNDKEKLGAKLSDDEKETILKEVEGKIKFLENNEKADTEELKLQKKSWKQK